MPKVWVDRDDRVAGDCPAGPIGDDEPVAKFLNSESWDPASNSMKDGAFQKKYLLPPKDRPPNNTAGTRDGESLNRCSGLKDDDILKLAKAQSPQDCQGAAVASVAAIRSITLPHDGSVLFRIYEDPTIQDANHCVIRFDPAHRSILGWARVELKRAFAKI